MTKEHRSLMMRSNRLLGAALVEHNLVKIGDLEKANERLLEIVAQEHARQNALMAILAYELKAVTEEKILRYAVEREGASTVDLRCYDVAEDFQKNMDLDACWATWSVPFDQEDGFYFVASAYFLSPAVRKYWEKQLEGPILWFGTTMEGIADYLEKMQRVGTAAPTAI